MTSKAVEYVKKNISSLLDHYKNRENPEVWIKNALGENAFVDTELFQDVEDFELAINKSKPAADDVANIKTLYSKFIELNDSFAGDERLWAGLSHTVFYDYVLDRFAIESEGDILNHFFFKQGKPRCYMVNSLARLWWIGRMLYDEVSDDHFKLLDYISHDINGCGFPLFGSNWSNNKPVLYAFFNAIFEFDPDNNGTVGRELFNDARKYVQCLTGKMIIDVCDQEYVQSKVYNYLIDRSKAIEVQNEIDRAQNIKRTGIARLDKIVRALNELGGMGDVRSIYASFAKINGDISESDKEYIKTNLNSYSPDVSSGDDCKGRIFYKTKMADYYCWRLANDYLTYKNLESRIVFVSKRIEKLRDFDKQIFNIINLSKKDRFTIGEINSLKIYLPDLDNLDSRIRESLKVLRENAIVEYCGNGEYKKVYKM